MRASSQERREEVGADVANGRRGHDARGARGVRRRSSVDQEIETALKDADNPLDAVQGDLVSCVSG
jgi:hypothetical protein